MASRTMDIKLSFEQFDMTPGAGGRKFLRNLLLHGGKLATARRTARVLVFRTYVLKL